jgi:hypothetical protein
MGVKAGQHAHMAEFGADVFGGFVQLEVATFDTLHGSYRGDGLGHRGNPTHRVLGHGIARAEGAFTKSTFVQNALAVSHSGHHTGHSAGLHACAQQGIDLIFHGHGGSFNHGFAKCFPTLILPAMKDN